MLLAFAFVLGLVVVGQRTEHLSAGAFAGAVGLQSELNDKGVELAWVPFGGGNELVVDQGQPLKDIPMVEAPSAHFVEHCGKSCDASPGCQSFTMCGAKCYLKTKKLIGSEPSIKSTQCVSYYQASLLQGDGKVFVGTTNAGLRVLVPALALNELSQASPPVLTKQLAKYATTVPIPDFVTEHSGYTFTISKISLVDPKVSAFMLNTMAPSNLAFSSQISTRVTFHLDAKSDSWWSPSTSSDADVSIGMTAQGELNLKPLNGRPNLTLVSSATSIEQFDISFQGGLSFILNMLSSTAKDDFKPRLETEVSNAIQQAVAEANARAATMPTTLVAGKGAWAMK
jgi:hypothetical protein